MTLASDLHEIMSSTVDEQPRGENATKTCPSCDTNHNVHKKANERDWKNLRHRLASVAAAVIAGRHEAGDADRHRVRWPSLAADTQQKQKEPSLFQISSADKLTTRGANPRTGVISPSDHTDSSNESENPHPRPSQKWKMNGDEWVSVGVSYQTPSSESSLSEDRVEGCAVPPLRVTKSSSGWEDQFVVNMPSAKDPNPPIMTMKQIQEYQEWLKNYFATDRECKAGSHLESTTDAKQEHRSPPESDNPTKTSVEPAESAAAVLERSPSLAVPGQYFTPDEIHGFQVSPIEETEQLSREELRRKATKSFIGCMEIDRAAAKNPDEILLFVNPIDDFGGGPAECPPIPSSSTSKNDSASQNSVKNVPRNSAPQEAGRLPPSEKQSTVTESQEGCRKIPNPASARKETPVGPGTARKEEGDVSSKTHNVKRVKMAVPAQNYIQPPTEQCSRKQNSIPHSTSLPSCNSPNTSSEIAHRRTASVPKQRRCPHWQNAEPQEPRSNSASASDDNVTQVSSGNPNGEKQSSAVPKKDGTRNGNLKSNTNEISKGAINGPARETISPVKGARNLRGGGNRRVPSVAELDGLQVNDRSPSPSSRDLQSTSSESKTPADSQRSSPDPESSNKRRDIPIIRLRFKEKAANVKPESTNAGETEEQLAAARKYAERLAEARAAFELFRQQRAKGVLPQKTQVPLNRVGDRAKASQAGSHTTAAAKKSSVGSPDKGIAEGANSKKSSIPQTSVHSEQRLTGDEGDDAHHISDTNNIFSLDGQSLDSLIFTLTARVSGQLRHKMVLHYVFRVGDQLVHMVKQCYRVSWRLMKIYFEYKRSGQLPETDHEELAQIGRDIVRMVVNILVLGFILMLVGRAAGYVILVASWIVWLSRPFRWLFGQLLGVQGF